MREGYLKVALLVLLACSCAGCVPQLAAYQVLRGYDAGIIPDGYSIDFHDNPSLTDRDVKAMSGALRVAQPYSLHLDGTQVTDKAFDTIVRMRGLERLHLGGTGVTPEGVDRFLRRASSVKAVGVPNHWDKTPELREQLEALIRAHPDVQIELMYSDVELWRSRDIGAPERRHGELWMDEQDITDKLVADVAGYEKYGSFDTIYLGGTDVTVPQLQTLLDTRGAELKVIGIPEALEHDPELRQLMARHPEIQVVVRYKEGGYWWSREVYTLSGPISFVDHLGLTTRVGGGPSPCVVASQGQLLYTALSSADPGHPRPSHDDCFRGHRGWWARRGSGETEETEEAEEAEEAEETE